MDTVSCTDHVKLHHEFGLQFVINTIQLDGKKRDSFNTLTGRKFFPSLCLCVALGKIIYDNENTQSHGSQL